jgi:hypothetical protein
MWYDRYTNVYPIILNYMNGNTVGRLLSKTERAYLAGLIDGDGAIMATIESHKGKRFGYRVRVSVKVTQLHLKDVDWLIPLTGIGYLRHSVRCFEWIVIDQRAAHWLLSSLAPYVRAKINQVRIALKILNSPIISQASLIKVAQLADSLSKFNVRSKSRRKNFASMIDNIPRND